MKPCFRRTDIYIPNESVDLSKWSVVACDQYTSEPEYWNKVKNLVDDSPSTFNIIFPEVYLNENYSRVDKIHNMMNQYLKDKIITEKVKQGFVLTERDTVSGKRIGLVGVVDLEQYTFISEPDKKIRATEDTIISRIPPRVKIREGASIESTHVMLLIDDPDKKLIENIYDNRESFNKIYDFELMMNGGHIKGYAIDGEKAIAVENAIFNIQTKSNGLFLAVGDGNHSLATAKACWENLKKNLSSEQLEAHPSRYALVELVNLHSPALIFEPIHRVIFNTDQDHLIERFVFYLQEHEYEFTDGKEIVFIQNSKRKGFDISNKKHHLPVDILQCFLDDYLEKHKNTDIDYIHGEEVVNELTKGKNNCGILLNKINKNLLFDSIVAGGSLPRKTFSLGEAFEKRYYLECRKIL